jgi:uncharacterized membrane protein
MGKTRFEAFSDGVIAIIITIMVLELKVPHATDIEALRALAPTFFSYVLSFVFVGIYWNNHHHMLHLTHKVNGAVLWANLNLLFWLSLVPFATAWMGENNFAQLPVAFYGFVLLMAAIGFFILSHALIALHGKDSPLAVALGKNRKALISLVLYSAAVLVSMLSSAVAMALYVIVAVMWLVPDRRIERHANGIK